MNNFSIREATLTDVEELAALHVQTFHETHGMYPGGPTLALRRQQWLDSFNQNNSSSFCFVVQNTEGRLIGFAKGVPYKGDLPGYEGELNKIYVLKAFQRRGLGLTLVDHVARRFIHQNITSMLLFGDAAAPANKFYE